MPGQRAATVLAALLLCCCAGAAPAAVPPACKPQVSRSTLVQQTLLCLQRTPAQGC